MNLSFGHNSGVCLCPMNLVALVATVFPTVLAMNQNNGININWSIMFAGITRDLHLTKKHPWKKEFINKSWERCGKIEIFFQRGLKNLIKQILRIVLPLVALLIMLNIYIYLCNMEYVQEMLQTKDTHCILVWSSFLAFLGLATFLTSFAAFHIHIQQRLIKNNRICQMIICRARFQVIN